ncbi:MAG: hypothetical protein DRP06_01405 [Candidatus Aenigmatarchaeota archaeon]|nr:MAG: hypothetical protein DRP06_01405 [Candidatus Aenigmarchaeota archaeon]
MQKILSKIGAGFIGAVMTGATLLAPAMAADLSDYPAPFVTDGTTDMLMVVGAAASPADVVGAINVAVRLGAEPGEEIAVSGDSVTVTGGEDKEIALDTALNDTTAWGNALDDGDLAGFLDTKVEVNDTDYDIKEELSFTGDAIIVSGFDDEDYGSDIVLETSNEGAVIYKYVFDDPIPHAEITSDEPLEINFMGTDLEITSIDEDDITLSMATEYYLVNGESVTVSGKTVVLDGVGETSVRVKVDGTTGTVGEDHTETINGIKVELEKGDIFYVDEVSQRSATLNIGEETTKSYNEGDGIVPLGEPEDGDDAKWVWEFGDDGANNLTYIAALYNVQADDADEEVIALGESLVSPNNYFSVELASATTEAYADYTISFDEVDFKVGGGELDDVPAMILKSSLEEGFTVAGADAAEVYMIWNDSVDTTLYTYYKDKDGDYFNGSTLANINVSTDTLVDLVNEDTTINVWVDVNATNSTNNVRLENKALSTDDINLAIGYNTAGKPTHLGVTAEEAAAADLKYNAKNIGTYDEDFRTVYGVIVKEPENNADQDEVELSIPEEQVKVNVIIKGPGTTTSTTTGATVKSVIPIKDNIARLDTDAEVESAKGSKNMIIIGGPAVNRLTAAVLGLSYPTYGVDSTVPENAAMVKLVENAFGGGKIAYVVAGWEAANTGAACSVLQQYDDYSALTGTGVKVSGTATPYEVTALE